MLRSAMRTRAITRKLVARYICQFNFALSLLSQILQATLICSQLTNSLPILLETELLHPSAGNVHGNLKDFRARATPELYNFNTLMRTLMGRDY